MFPSAIACLPSSLGKVSYSYLLHAPVSGRALFPLPTRRHDGLVARRAWSEVSSSREGVRRHHRIQLPGRDDFDLLSPHDPVGAEENGGARGGVPDIIHGSSRMTIDPRIPAVPGRSTSGNHRPGRHCLHQALRSTVACWASRMKGGLHPTTNRLRGGLVCE